MSVHPGTRDATTGDDATEEDGKPPGTRPRRGGIRRHRGGQTWRSLLFAPAGDGQTRRRGSDGVRVALAVLAVFLCWLAVHASSHTEQDLTTFLHSAPDGVSWVVATVWWVGTVGVLAVLTVVALLSRRWRVIRDALVAGLSAWLITLGLQALLGPEGGRPPDPSLNGVDLSFPIARIAVTVAVILAMLPYLSRWLQLSTKTVIGVVALATVVHGAGTPVSVLASLALGWGVTAAVHLVFQSPLGLPSAGEVTLLLGDLDLSASGVAPCQRQEWGVGRFTGQVGDDRIDVSVYGRDASDAQLLAKTFRFLLYRDSGPTLALTRIQQVEHEAYLTLSAERAGARVPEVLVAGPAGPARDAVLVTRPPGGRPLSTYLPAPAEQPLVADAPSDDGTATGGAESATTPSDGGASTATAGTAPPPGDGAAPPAARPAGEGTVDDDALDSLFHQVATLRAAEIAHGSISTETVVVDDGGTAGLVDFRSASIRATRDQLDSDVAAALSAAALVAGSERAAAAAARVLDADDLAAALPFLQRAALDPVAARSLRGKKTLLANTRVRGAGAAGVEVPKLVEPRRVSWVNLALVVGTLVGGWALIAVLVNVGKSWSTITGADWVWVGVVFVLSQTAYPAIAVTTVGSVTSPLPFGRTLALEVSNTFVALAGGSMAVLATRIRFFQKQGYDATLAISSGVLVSTASWIVKGALFLIALPIAYSNLHFSSTPSSDSSSSDAHLVWILVAVVVVVGVAAGLLLAIPRWRRAAAQKLRPKATEVWAHLKVLAAHPRNLVEIFGGNVVAQIVIAMALGAALHAFGDHLGLATLLVVLTLASMLGGVSPVPGGMGVVEAGMILGLTAAGISETDAVAATFVQRLFTAYLPPIWGWFVLVWLRRKDYL
jgi:uncharacterized membrane protein YbhN (UPF0104 family)